MGRVGVWTGTLPGPCRLCWGSAAVAFFPRRLAVWGMAAFVLERLSDREVLVGKGSPRQPIRKKAADAILPLCATHTGHGREKVERSLTDGPWPVQA